MPSSAEPRLAPGDRFDRYVLLERVGRGAMGTVFAAYDPRLDRRIALKIVHRSVAEKAGETLRMQSVREAQALARLSHPNVVTVHDVDEADGQLFIAMAFIEGATLGPWAEASDRTREEVLAVLLAAGRGLAAVHDAGLVHRDFKPANVMVGGGGDEPWRPWVMDFGLARRAAGRPSVGVPGRLPSSPDEIDVDPQQSEGSRVGTPAYMAPEQHLALDAEAPADQFSFCVAAYEALYGRRPFDSGSGLAALAAAVCQGDVRDPPAGTGVPEYVWPVLRRGLAAEPDDRWPSMRDLLQALTPPSAPARRAVPWPAVVLTVLAGGVAVGLAVGDTDDDDPCRQTLVPLDELWGSDTAGKLSAHLGEALPTTRAAEAVIERLDVFADAWRRGRLTACLADEDGEREGDGDAALRRSCFDLRLVELGTWLDVLRNDDPAQTRAAAIAVEGIESPTVCDDLANLRRNAVTSVPEASLGRAQALQEQLQRGIVYASAGRHEQAISILDDTIAAAEALDIRVLQAGALAERAALCLRRQEFEAAEDNGLEAYRIGVRERNDDVALTAAVVMARLCNESQMPAAATEAWAVHALALAERRGDPATQAKVYEALAIAHSEGAPDRSREYFDLAVEAAQVAHGARSHALAVVRLNAGVADLRRGDATSAQAHLEEALAVVEELDGVDTHLTVHTRRELAAAVGAAGDRTRALGLCRENLPHIVAAFGRQSMPYGQQLELMAALACDDGDLDGCARYATDSIAAFEASLGPEARFLLGPLVSLAEAHARRGDTKAARVAARRGKALALLHDAPEGAAHFEAVAPAPAR